MRKYVTYYRVSTAEQGRSGLGLEAQRRDIALFLESYSDQPFELIGSFTDVGSGADNDRPAFQQAIALCKKTGSELLVAKLDRLSRRVSKIAELIEDRRLVFRVAAMPFADPFQLHIYAALAEQEREFISRRTKAALSAAKARGVKLGGHREGAIEKAIAARVAAADDNARRVAPIVTRLKAQSMTLEQIAGFLNENRVATASGTGRWSPKQVRRVLARVA